MELYCLNFGIRVYIKKQDLITHVNSLRLRQTGCHFAAHIFKLFFFLVWKWMHFESNLLKFVPKGAINSNSEVVQKMADTLVYWSICVTQLQWVNTLRPRQHGHHFPDDIFRCIFLNENIWIAINISLSIVPKGPIDNIPAFGSNNGLAPVRQQAIIWTNDG